MNNTEDIFDDSMEVVFEDVDVEQGEIIFKTDIADDADKPWWHLLPYTFGCGAIIGLLAWFQFDGIFRWTHMLIWASGGSILISGIAFLPFFRKNELRKICVCEDYFTVINRNGKKTYQWKDLQAAHFEQYPIVNLQAEISCFNFRINDKNKQLILDGFKEKLPLLSIVFNAYLGRHGIPKEIRKLRTFQHNLSRVATGMFIGSLITMAIAYWLVFRTLGLIAGISIMLTGTIIALLTWKQKLSKYVIVASATTIITTITLVNVYDINLRETLLKWEKQERRLGRPPWNETTPSNTSQQSHDTISDIRQGPGT